MYKYYLKNLKEEILVRYDNVIKWANTHHQPRDGKGVNKHNRLRAVANHMMKEDKSHQWKAYYRILRQNGFN